jgi:hypothetical protein
MVKDNSKSKNCMKKPLYFLFVTLFIITSNSSFAQKGKDLYSINKDRIDINFTTAYQFDDLVKVKFELNKLNIKIAYQSLSFDKNGKLKQISASIKYPDGEAGSFVSRELQESNGPGFRRNLK